MRPRHVPRTKAAQLAALLAAIVAAAQSRKADT